MNLCINRIAFIACIFLSNALFFLQLVDTFFLTLLQMHFFSIQPSAALFRHMDDGTTALIAGSSPNPINTQEHDRFSRVSITSTSSILATY